jgi:hypothetical protein
MRDLPMRPTRALRAGLAGFAGLLAASVLAGCTSQPVILPSHDFDRPTDVTFVCMETVSATATADGGTDGAEAGVTEAGAEGGVTEAGVTAEAGTEVGATEAGAASTGAVKGDLVLTGRPMRVCHPRDALDGANPALHTFAFLPNSSSGDLSVVDADHWRPVNLDPANAGYNRLPIGTLPTQISASDDGCRLVTANHGSCDLSLVDPAALLAPTVLGGLAGVNGATSVSADNTKILTPVVPKTKSGRALSLFAGEISFLPTGTPNMTVDGANQCSANPSQPWQALVTFPSCDLVALIDLPSGTIQRAAKVTTTATGGVALVPVPNDEPDCPVDCKVPPAAAGAVDASAVDAVAASPDANATSPDADATSPDAGATSPVAGGTSPDEANLLLPGPIAISPEPGGRAYVGLANAAFVLAFNVGRDTLTLDPGGGGIPLREGAMGVNRLRLSIDPYKDKTNELTLPAGAFVGADQDPNRKYLYVIARDGSVRVVWAVEDSERECETNVDFGGIVDDGARTQAMQEACPTIGAQARRPGAIGPGIRLPTPPVDVAAADIRSTATADQSETSVMGAHAWVLTASGSVYLVNIDPVLRKIAWVDDTPRVRACTAATTDDCETEPTPAPNTLRDRNFLGYTVALDPSSGAPRLDVPPSQASIGPRIETVWTVGSSKNATATTTDYIRSQVFFPDRAAVTPQTWAVTWEGDLLPSPRLSGQFDTATGTLKDLGLDFCRAGVLKDDIVTLLGCTNANQCGIGKTCVLGSKGSEGAGGLAINGLCMTPATPKTICDHLLSTIRRYDVTSATQGELPLEPHKDELSRPAIKPCTPASAAGADGGADGGGDAGAADATELADAAASASPDGGDAATDGRDAADAKATSADASSASILARVPKSDCIDPQDPSTAKFQCLEFEGSRHCLQPCYTDGDTSLCRTGRICVTYGQRATPIPSKKDASGNPIVDPCDNEECFCADGPRLTNDSKADVQACMGELFPYQVGVGRGFLVSGSQTSLPATGTADATGSCVPLTGLDPRVAIRIPMNAPRCGDDILGLNDNTRDSRCDPDVSSVFCADQPDMATPQTIANDLYNFATAPGDQNPCLFFGGPNETDSADLQPPPEHVHARFRNREVQIMMTNLERPPSGIFQIHFDVHGGFQPQVVAIPNTVEVTMPARLVLGPFDSNPVQTGTTPSTGEIPYLFVVDQRRLGRSQGGGPTRGQLLRIHPLGYAIASPVVGYQPWFEDLAHSANLFPIQ